MQNQYTRQAERAIKYAARMARKLKHPYIGTEHLLLGLRSEITGGRPGAGIPRSGRRAASASDG